MLVYLEKTLNILSATDDEDVEVSMYSAGVIVASDSAGIVDTSIDFTTKNVTCKTYQEAIKQCLKDWVDNSKKGDNNYVTTVIPKIEAFFQN